MFKLNKDPENDQSWDTETTRSNKEENYYAVSNEKYKQSALAFIEKQRVL